MSSAHWRVGTGGTQHRETGHDQQPGSTGEAGLGPGLSGSPRIAVFYQRPVDDPFHGGSAHARGFLAVLSRFASVTVVAPREAQVPNLVPHIPSIPLSASNIVRALAAQIVFVVREAIHNRGDRSNALIIFDVYSAALPLIWARVTGTKLAYYAQDFGERVSKDLSKTRSKGRTAFRILRIPLERALIHYADVLSAVSEPVKNDLVGSGGSPQDIVICEMPRQMALPDPDQVVAWRNQLGLEQRLSIVFVGNLGYPPNQKAADFILESVVPFLDSARSEWKLILVGPGTERLVPSDGRVICLGAVPDLDNLLFACHIGIAPVEIEGGVSGKLVDYLLHGLVALATPQAASGVPPVRALRIASIDCFGETLRSLVDSESLAGIEGSRSLDPVIAMHYLSGSGISTLLARLLGDLPRNSSNHSGTT